VCGRRTYHLEAGPWWAVALVGSETIRCVLCVGFCLIVAGRVVAEQCGEPLPVECVPAVVKEAVEKAAPGVTWQAAFRFESKGQTTWYRLGGYDRKNCFVMTMRVKADGKLGYFQRTVLARGRVGRARRQRSDD
jgi:hypothetical protein